MVNKLMSAVMLGVEPGLAVSAMMVGRTRTVTGMNPGLSAVVDPGLAVTTMIVEWIGTMLGKNQGLAAAAGQATTTMT